MTEIESLIKQAKAIKARKLSPKPEPQLPEHTWQEILDNKPYPNIRVSNP